MTPRLVHGLTEIAGPDIDGLDIAGLDNGGPDIDRRTWATDCNQPKITIERFYQLTGTYNSFETVSYTHLTLPTTPYV